MTHVRRAWILAGLVGVAALTIGCTGGGSSGEVSGTVTVDGQTPAAGSSITFFPTDGKSPTAGAAIEGGKYSAQVAVGPAKVEIRVPRASGQAAGSKSGPGSGPGGGRIEESLPAKYHDQSELSIEVKSGKNPKNWDLSTK